MHDAAGPAAPDRKPFAVSLVTLARDCVPTLAEVSLTVFSAALLVLSFPNFDLSPLAWIALVPLLFAVIKARKSAQAFVLGWLWGALFFYGSCWWLAYPMINYGKLPPWLAYLLLFVPVAFCALFPAVACLVVARLVSRFGRTALFLPPFVWVSFEWARYATTGQVWNAIGYSQAFHPLLIQTARWGGVYAVGFLLVSVNVTVVFALVSKTRRSLLICLAVVAALALSTTVAALQQELDSEVSSDGPPATVVAVQPNVPMEGGEMQQLLDRHLQLGSDAVRALPPDRFGLLVVWPESPMNFTYSTDTKLQKAVGDFAIANHADVLLNSLEPAPNGGEYNSAILVNQEGRKVAQYDKIRLMPFGEYVPLPRWLPGASSVRTIVGEFTPGSSYTLMPLGAFRGGVFICVESTHPAIARAFTKEGADVLVNISNDGYLGPTAVMRQHLANAVFRAVENDRPLLRVTNTCISAFISASGRVSDQTPGFESATRTWIVRRETRNLTFYSKYGDVFVYACMLTTLGLTAASFFKARNNFRKSTIKRG